MFELHRKLVAAIILSFLAFLGLGIWQFIIFQMRPADDFYQPSGYIRRVNEMIRNNKLYFETEKSQNAFRPQIRLANLEPQEKDFFENSWLKEDVAAFNEGNSDVFLIEKGRLKEINIYRHRVESPLAGEWNWWGRVYSQSSEGYAYLWNSRRTLKLYRPASEERASARIAQSDFREVVYGRGQLFQTGLGISLKGRYGNRIADVYVLGKNIVLKSYSGNACFINGHSVLKGLEQRLEEGDLVQIYFDRKEREEYLFHDFSQKPLSFVNLLNGKISRTNLDRSFHFIPALTLGIETAAKKIKKENRAEFDVHLALDEDLAGITQNTLDNFLGRLSRNRVRAGCTILDARNGQILATASAGKNPEDVNENFKLHPVGSATKIFLAAAAAQNYPDLLSLEIDPHNPGEEKTLLGYELQQGVKLRLHRPLPGEAGRIDFETYIAKSCNRYHAILPVLSLAKDSALISGNKERLFHGIALTGDTIDNTNGNIYLEGELLSNKPDLGYFVTEGPQNALECRNLESSEMALNLERLFNIRRIYYEGSKDLFAAEPWNLLFARLGLEQRPDLYPAFYPVMPQTPNLGLNLNIDFRLDFISILFGGATNRWNNIKLAEAISRLVTGRKINARFVNKLTENGHESYESSKSDPLELNPEVRRRLLAGMEEVCLPGGTAADLYPTLMDLRERIAEKYSLEFYAKTGTPFRQEIRKGEEEIYSSVILLTAVLRDRETDKIQDALSFAVYVEDQGEHKAIEMLKQLLGRILLARRWIL